MFRGNAPARIDDKGRLKVPNTFKSLLESKYGRELFLTSLTGEYVRIYPMPVWLETRRKARPDAVDASVAAPISRSRQLLRPGRRARHAGTRADPRAAARGRDDGRRRRRARARSTASTCGTTIASSPSCSATRTPTTTRGRCRSSGFDGARAGDDGRGAADAAAGTRRPLRRLHGRPRRPRARAARSGRDAAHRPRSRS